MARNIKKSIETYNKKYLNSKNNPTGKGLFAISDYAQIKETAEENNGDIYDIIDAALKAGFIVGYNQAKKDLKQSSC